MWRGNGDKEANVVKKSLFITVLTGVGVVTAGCGGGNATGGQGRNFTTIYENHAISTGAPINPYNTNGNTWLSFDQMQLAWSAHSATDLNKFYPGLAKTWTISPDGSKVTVELQPNARWSNGKPVTADDVKTSMAIAFTQGNAQSFFLGSVKAISPTKIEFDQVPGQHYNLFFHDLMQQTIVPS
jgi:peptide/nickel transport system substrate-binding protein